MFSTHYLRSESAGKTAKSGRPCGTNLGPYVRITRFFQHVITKFTVTDYNAHVRKLMVCRRGICSYERHIPIRKRTDAPNRPYLVCDHPQ